MSQKIELNADTKWSAIPKIMRELAEMPNLKVGILEGTGVHPYSYRTLISEIGYYLEFGTDIEVETAWGPAEQVRIPARPFIGKAMRENEKKIKKAIGKSLEKVLQGRSSGMRIFNALGLMLQSMVRKAIDDTTYPPLAEATLEKKGYEKWHPLIEYGILKGAISYAEDK